MRTKLHQQVLETIRRHGMMSAGDRVGVAVSGGADSVAMLRLLEELREPLGITLAVVHLNHTLRGEESDADERFVATLARESNLEFVSAREDVAAEAQRQGWNLEDAARRLRYGFFARVVAEGGATRVAVAHTADDQAETILARLIRGTGLTGLGGIYPVVGQVVRPLLEVRRQDLRGFLARRRQAWREDETNRDSRRLRSRIRKELLPLLERDFSGAIVERLDGLARLARGEEIFWSALIEDRCRALVSESPQGHVVRIPDLLSPLALGSFPPRRPRPHDALRVLSQRLIRRIVEGMRGDRRQLTAYHVDQVLHLATRSSSGHRVHLPGGMLVERDFDRLIFSLTVPEKSSRRARETGQAAGPYEYVVSLARRGLTAVSVPELGRRFSLKVIDWPVAPSDTKGAAEALDADRLLPPLVLRNWRPGDAYRPQGRAEFHKLKELFQAGRIAARERSRWPVLTSGGNLVWVRGMLPAEEYRAREGTRIGLVIAEEDL